MMPSGRKFSGLEAGLEGLGMKLRSADLAVMGSEGGSAGFSGAVLC